MAPLRLSRANPLAFARWPVTLITAVVYLAFLIPLLIVHHVVPSPPTANPNGLDLTQAWADLQVLTDGFHPYNSRRNDEVHTWLLQRIHEILDAAPPADQYLSVDEEKPKPAVFVFDDTQSNLSFVGNSLSSSNTAVYFESTNILVYIRGSDDDHENWWEEPNGVPSGKGGVLVNAHYDSVSTGYGATDDGVGVVTCLQLIQYFMTPGHAPRRGLVVLLNNGEEDYLNGARVYGQHPISKFPHTFLNLEGAGAGGRAILFRSSDTEVTRPYMSSKYPFGSVLAADGFATGLIGSQTDYVVFEVDLGLRGLDVAFMEPRARYHTEQDDSRHTSKSSLWHMLSAAVATTEGLVSDKSDQFEGAPTDDAKVASGSGSKAVWFDLFGTTFVLFELHTLFALSVTLLVVAPLALLVTGIALTRADKMYLFRTSAKADESLDSVPLQGLRGFFRFPFLFAIPTAVTVGLAYLVTKVNPLIIHSSEYAVWSMMLSAWTFLAWFVSRMADFARPTALHRIYTLTWMFVLAWVLLVISTVYQNQRGLAGSYSVFFFFSGTFLATWISYLELFSLPRKSEYANQNRPTSRRASSYGGSGQRTTFANYVRVAGDHRDSDTDHHYYPGVYKHEQRWSASLPTWTWTLQFLLMAPLVLIMVGPLALLLTSALHQTGQDGSSSLFIYVAIAALTTFLLTPLLPFIHRHTYHLPVFLLLVFLGTLIYNLVAFPFSPTNRLKLFFIQDIDLSTGSTTASLAGVQPYVHAAASTLPSTANQNITCTEHTTRGTKCAWPGLAPRVVPDTPYSDWLDFTISQQHNTTDDKEGDEDTHHPRKARITLSGRNTRACKLLFDSPISSFAVLGSSTDPRFPTSSPHGTKEIRLWSREWENEWVVDVAWTTSTNDDICLWSDNNSAGVIPALDEVRQFAPSWVAVSKAADGLVEGWKVFSI
ncbi:Protein kinase domain family protein [Aspergillus niger]|uniref:Peptide hydrolase n=1 Tax=Aspergillus niger TaxID=5061 RepID=A0A505HRU8_ASPNG|nr:Protein kinase domain family protein [Aspergillus niger]